MPALAALLAKAKAQSIFGTMRSATPGRMPTFRVSLRRPTPKPAMIGASQGNRMWGTDHVHGPSMVTKGDWGYGQTSSETCAVYSRRRLCPPGQARGRGRAGRGRSHPHRCHGRTLRAEHFDGDTDHRVTPADYTLAVGNPSDDREPGFVPGRVYRSWLRCVSRPLGREQQFASYRAPRQGTG